MWLKGRHTPVGAISRGRDILHIEAWLHIDVEKWLQSVTQPLWHFVNVYYDLAHLFVMLAFIGYVLALHRDQWRYFRNVLFATTFAGLLFQFLLSSAPPRFIGSGILDTANLAGMSIYSTTTHLDQYSTFPSLHVAWAAIIALVALRIPSSRIKYFWFAHLPTTVFAVVVSGNHFVLDCLAGFGLALAASWILRRQVSLP